MTVKHACACDKSLPLTVLLSLAALWAWAAGGCAPSSSAKYARHLSATAEPSYVDREALAEAQRMWREPAGGSVLAGAMSDDAHDE